MSAAATSTSEIESEYEYVPLIYKTEGYTFDWSARYAISKNRDLPVQVWDKDADDALKLTKSLYVNLNLAALKTNKPLSYAKTTYMTAYTIKKVWGYMFLDWPVDAPRNAFYPHVVSIDGDVHNLHPSNLALRRSKDDTAFLRVYPADTDYEPQTTCESSTYEYAPLRFIYDCHKYNYSRHYEISRNTNLVVQVRNKITGNVMRPSKVHNMIGLSPTYLYTDNPKWMTVSKKRGWLAYRLWMLVFRGDAPLEKNGTTKFTVDHIDRNHDNNIPTNLRWASGSLQAQNSHQSGAPITTKRLHTQTPRLGVDYKHLANTRYYVARDGTMIYKSPEEWKQRLEPNPVVTGYVMTSIKGYGPLLKHRLVAHLWPSPQDDFPLSDLRDRSKIVDHIDCNRSNNHRDNLRVTTQHQNTIETARRGRQNNQKRKVIVRPAPTPLKTYIGTFKSGREAMRQLGVSQDAVSSSCRLGVPRSGYFFEFDVPDKAKTLPKSKGKPTRAYKMSMVDADPSQTKVYDSITAACETLGLLSSAVYANLCGNVKDVHGYVFELHDPDDDRFVDATVDIRDRKKRRIVEAETE